MQTLTVSQETFLYMINGLIKSGVTFIATEKDGNIVIKFQGGY
jgi:hypothetical protein